MKGRLARSFVQFRGGAARVLRDFSRLGFVLAGSAIAFECFLSLMPLVALSGWVARLFAPDAEPLLSPLSTLMPGPVAEAAVAEAMSLGFDGMAWLAPVGLVA